MKGASLPVLVVVLAFGLTQWRSREIRSHIERHSSQSTNIGTCLQDVTSFGEATVEAAGFLEHSYHYMYHGPVRTISGK